MSDFDTNPMSRKQHILKRGVPLRAAGLRVWESRAFVLGWGFRILLLYGFRPSV